MRKVTAVSKKCMLSSQYFFHHCVLLSLMNNSAEVLILITMFTREEHITGYFILAFH